MPVNRLENIFLIKISGPVLRKIHIDFNNILVLQAIDLYFQKKRIGNGTYVLQVKKIL